ncbi:DNA polymerase I [Spiroplasma endosymbiont of Phyllotreta cruciferae]|uniref:DNA polymerase I n=1 Tax=Spiroplasma endosymbiont of Phyllotreta cruciferae TaxID=2886375 RepID=UPI00209F206D|nr:DNA polymerase I [Spiroplasma endosymbiont of Phyllotreta cruciferae]
MNKVLLIDGNALLFRAFYATAYNGEMLKSLDGTPTNAVYAFANMLNKILKANNYYSVVVAFDKGKKNFRHDLLADYKDGRSKTPEELIVQFPIVKEFLDSYQIPYLEQEGYEADDLLGCLAQQAEKEDFYVDIFSSDKDLYQLISDKTNILVPRQGDTADVIDEMALAEKWGVKPLQVPDLKGLMGDPSDNLKGVPGVGEKTAIKLIKEYHSIENLYDNIDKIKGTLQQNLLNNKVDALLCKKVATIFCDINLRQFAFTPFQPNHDALMQFYLKYNMNSFITKLFSNKDDFQNSELKVEIIEEWKEGYNEDNTTVYLELFDENYHLSEIIGFGIVNSKGVFYFDYINAKHDKLWHRFLHDPKYQKITYHAKSLIVALARDNIIVQNISYDMMLAGYVYNSNAKNTLDTYINLFEKKQILTDDLFYGKGVKKQIPADIIKLSQFIGEKTFYINKLQPKIIKLLKTNQQYDLYYDIELPTAFALARMEINGVKIDQQELTDQTLRIEKIVQELNNEINAIAQKEINPNSPKQVSELLYCDFSLSDLKKGSTAQEVLEEIKDTHQIIPKILDYRKYQKLYSTYLKGMEKYIFNDGKVHTIYKQTLTNTGRLSSVEPNMQNISIRDEVQKEVRKIFVVSTTDNILLSCDYSQIELRILAHMSKDSDLIMAFNNNEDIHTNTAMKIFNLPKAEITSNIRRSAKAVNFGIIYGISDFGLATDLNIPVYKAKEIINNYYQQFPTIKAFIDSRVEFCKQNGYVTTIFNRKRYVPEINDRNYMQREFGKRIAMNMPIQGSAADIIKIALKNIDQEFLKLNLKAKIIAQIHDELIFEIPQNELSQVKTIVKNLMEDSMVLDVKLLVDMKTGLSWYDLK